MDEPSKDQSYCDVGQHQACSGYTEDEWDAETCMCNCHDQWLRDEMEMAL